MARILKEDFHLYHQESEVLEYEYSQKLTIQIQDYSWNPLQVKVSTKKENVNKILELKRSKTG